MGLVGVDRPCPKCGVVGPYEDAVVRRGSGLGVPVVQWEMSVCGHWFATPEYSRWGAGWVRVDPGDRDAPRCE